MKLWVTKYALTKGIYRQEMEDPGHALEDQECVYASGQGQGFCYGSECFLDRDEAREMARSMARKKIASLEKQIVKLRELEREPKMVE